jgi:hypothetical protein
MNTPNNPGWYWYNDKDEWEIVLVEKRKFLYVKRLAGPVQSSVPISCMYGTWGSEIKRDER